MKKNNILCGLVGATVGTLHAIYCYKVNGEARMTGKQIITNILICGLAGAVVTIINQVLDKKEVEENGD